MRRREALCRTRCAGFAGLGSVCWALWLFCVPGSVCWVCRAGLLGWAHCVPFAVFRSLCAKRQDLRVGLIALGTRYRARCAGPWLAVSGLFYRPGYLAVWLAVRRRRPTGGTHRSALDAGPRLGWAGFDSFPLTSLLSSGTGLRLSGSSETGLRLSLFIWACLGSQLGKGSRHRCCDAVGPCRHHNWPSALQCCTPVPAGEGNVVAGRSSVPAPRRLAGGLRAAISQKGAGRGSSPICPPSAGGALRFQHWGQSVPLLLQILPPPRRLSASASRCLQHLARYRALAGPLLRPSQPSVHVHRPILGTWASRLVPARSSISSVSVLAPLLVICSVVSWLPFFCVLSLQRRQEMAMPPPGGVVGRHPASTGRGQIFSSSFRCWQRAPA